LMWHWSGPVPVPGPDLTLLTDEIIVVNFSLDYEQKFSCLMLLTIDNTYVVITPGLLQQLFHFTR